jgi:RNA polymerase sigma-70 factor (ECF subfamily)
MKRSQVESVLAGCAPALLGYFLRRTADAEDAADLVGETLTQAWRVADRVPADPEAARMWVFGVARNTLRHHVRGGVRRDALIVELGSALTRATGEVDDGDLDVRRAVAALPIELAELVRLVHWDGFSIEQAATLMEIPASTARSRHARAKELLRAALAVAVE